MASSTPPPDGSFQARVIAVVRRIPRGRVATYGDVAALAGRPRAWRAVGTIMRTCRLPSVPCHRVVGAGGRVGGYSDPLRKRRLLQDEGVVVGRGTIRQFDAIRWTEPGSGADDPLRPALSPTRRRRGARDGTRSERR